MECLVNYLQCCTCKNLIHIDEMLLICSECLDDLKNNLGHYDLNKKEFVNLPRNIDNWLKTKEFDNKFDRNSVIITLEKLLKENLDERGY